MASRDNQGLQIALILLVMLVVALSATTVIFYNANVDSQQKALAANEKSNSESSKAREYLNERNRLKVIIGHTEETTMDDVETQFAEDVASFVADENGTPPNLQAMSYRKIPVELRNKYGTLEQQLAQAREREAALVAERDTIRTTSEANIKKSQDQQDAYAADLRKVENEAMTTRQSLQNEQRKVLQAKVAMEGQVQKLGAEKDTVIASISKERDDLERLNDALSGRVEDAKPKASDIPDGTVVWANQRSRTVWVNLGSGDYLRPQMSFAVYEKGDTNLASAEKKGSIEITRIHDTHQAEARMTDFKSNDPIMPGDTIFTPTWTPGRPEKFAIVGMIDIDLDDRDDTPELRRIIESAGGNIVAWVDEKGDIKGTITPDVRYLILGEQPDERSTELALKSYTQMKELARRNGIDAVRVDRFLDWAGYVGSEELVRLKTSSRLEELEAKAEKEKSGFQPRRPEGSSAF